MSVNIQVPTLSQRKAARRPSFDAPVATPEESPMSPSVSAAEAPLSTEASWSAPQAPTSDARPMAKPAPDAQPAPSRTSVFIPEPASALNLNLSREALAEIAKQMGLSLTPQRKEYIKHSYSVTSEAKATFSSYCDVLGFKMQEALDEAFSDFFAKYRDQYERVKNAKTKG